MKRYDIAVQDMVKWARRHGEHAATVEELDELICGYIHYLRRVSLPVRDRRQQVRCQQHHQWGGQPHAAVSQAVSSRQGGSGGLE